jgi:DNA-binding NarL/FixJ family response regulator
LTAAIHDVAAGGSIIRPVVTERVLRGLEHVRRDFDALSPPDPLTKREVEILRLMRAVTATAKSPTRSVPPKGR